MIYEGIDYYTLLSQDHKNRMPFKPALYEYFYLVFDQFSLHSMLKLSQQTHLLFYIADFSYEQCKSLERGLTRNENLLFNKLHQPDTDKISI